jgi:hypothetical protein
MWTGLLAVVIFVFGVLVGICISGVLAGRQRPQ